jgi:pyruvyl transferase EpsO
MDRDVISLAVSDKSTHSSAMRSLARKTDELSTVIPTGSLIGFVDYPMHINVGDLLIFLGAMDFFQANANDVGVSFCLYDATSAALDRLENVDVIALHGGGNFGDIYPKHQRLRERVVSRFPHKRIVVMPQSVHFQSDQTMRESAAVFRKHPNVSICVRDRPSEAMVRENFTDHVLLLPDSAHRLYGRFAGIRDLPLDLQAAPLKLLRRDIETVGGTGHPSQGIDWNVIMRLDEKIRMERHRLAARLRGWRNGTSPAAVESFGATVEAIVFAIASRLTTFNHWITTRLHGAILGLILDKRVELINNSYGKNSRYFQQWDPDGQLLLSFACKHPNS